MRIIAGEARGRKLKSIKGTTTRPTIDRVKESLFNILGPYISGMNGLDLFAGFGTLGLEAISRGANSFLFVEKDIRNVSVIKKNIELCGFKDKGQVIKDDVFNFLVKTRDKFDIILMDPPYNKGLVERTISEIISAGLLSEMGMIVAEYFAKENIADYEQLLIVKQRIYGDTGITIFQLEGAEG